ncbi:hypothetical protein EJ110_NYTH53753 [Nymphaea thermarum]|nr:hypothetical protein EJ110_NYTH53753 [Nymphaea thermarum]
MLHIACVGIRPCPKLTKEEIDVLKKEQDAAETKKSSSKSSVSVPLYAIEPHEDASKKRRTLSQAFNNMGRAEMDRRIRSLSGYIPPSSEKLRTIILAEEKANIEKLLEKEKFSWIQYGVSIVSDGWTDIQRRPLINFIAYSFDGPIFLKSVDASGEYKDDEYLKGLFIEVIKEVGENNVVQIVTDNAPITLVVAVAPFAGQSIIAC